MKILLAMLVALFTASAHAMLPPVYDSISRIEVVLASEEVTSVSVYDIVNIAVVGLKVTVQFADQCAAIVQLKTVPPAKGMIGATVYEVESVDTLCPVTN